ncbi:hypothetical protein CONPUDRAFT_151506 [Coniophora puteana RWD-64-598 SS2]|uniref:F-box domain-containing protein n=1 Tax=Coniophora puteana (strain RWD-64-598) TaxID=741705 RepID=A0A5M3MZC0_CONPW|nr:uncharacterized protein CONPUDRAFT_151506 [Coniophora puteana RWD-64-598 SS2]EIW84488.1 hypothetical protein CONPUDRAFT_151506 [Coniophora puteana RWD-64-598 SS2]
MALPTWDNLISLTIDMKDNDFSFDALDQIFTQAPNLVELWISEDVIESTGWQPARIASKKLRLFSLVVDPYWINEAPEQFDIGPVFDSLMFPALSDLVVTIPMDGNLDFLRHFIARSGCRLSSLTFTEIFDEAFGDPESSLIRRAGVNLAEEYGIPSVEFTYDLDETRIYQKAKDRWYCMDDQA